jgi:hypothetical protein
VGKIARTSIVNAAVRQAILPTLRRITAINRNHIIFF